MTNKSLTLKEFQKEKEDLVSKDYLRKELKLQGNRIVNKIIKKLNIVINGFDRLYLNHEKRIRKVEQNLGIPLDVN